MSARLVGHELLYEGAPFLKRGRNSFSAGGLGTGGNGHGKCSCGALSDWLDSGNKRKQWHRAHKDEIRAAVALAAALADPEGHALVKAIQDRKAESACLVKR